MRSSSAKFVFRMVALASLLAVTFARGEIEKTATTTAHGLKLRWWPKLSIPDGWCHDEEASEAQCINVLLPKGKTFDDAPTIIYGRAQYAPDPKTRGTLASFIKDDIEDQRSHEKGLIIKQLPAVADATKHKFRTYSFVNPGKAFERVCYRAEGKYWVLLVISSKTHSDLEKDLGKFKQVVAKYR